MRFHKVICSKRNFDAKLCQRIFRNTSVMTSLFPISCIDKKVLVVSTVEDGSRRASLVCMVNNGRYSIF